MTTKRPFTTSPISDVAGSFIRINERQPIQPTRTASLRRAKPPQDI